jgi:CBS domain-containing protein
VLGIITIDDIKNKFMETSLNHFFLADDLMDPAGLTTTPNAPISKVKELFTTYDLECLPVITEEKKLVGIIERKQLDILLSKKYDGMQKLLYSIIPLYL